MTRGQPRRATKLSGAQRAWGRQRALEARRVMCRRCAGKGYYRGGSGALVDPCDACLGSKRSPIPIAYREQEAAGTLQPVSQEGLAMAKMRRAPGNPRDYNLADAVYELLVHRETQEVWAVRWTDGHLSGARDTVDDERVPTRDELPTLEYYPPDKGDEARLLRDKRQWVIIARWTRFVSAFPPQWVLDRQAVTRANTVEETEP